MHAQWKSTSHTCSTPIMFKFDRAAFGGRYAKEKDYKLEKGKFRIIEWRRGRLTLFLSTIIYRCLFFSPTLSLLYSASYCFTQPALFRQFDASRH
ncbi:uncharacterized protein FA14DRAFT_84075 [Meira miltonrushii]|uniref:Uncharacterized protein n=1 Tax=Meira miltonrushii TaxID=1280837 RepID=A0A316V984_9BASI|nr:uncharacterized protein FA14DRAFT_84075 [Meira miltonrushii]PWN32035.1 hypothetical protein FA14DRAFT_84075 [Meira miltonrushii]